MGEVHDGLYLLQHSPSEPCAILILSHATLSFQPVFNYVFHFVFNKTQPHIINNVKILALSGILDLGIPLMLRFMF